MEKVIILSALAAGVIFFAVLAFLTVRCCEARLPGAEKFLRNRTAGAILSAAALAWCAPQVQAVIWTSWVPWVWYLALAALVLSVLYLDNIVARGFAGLLIMGAYSFLDMTFDCKLDMGISGALPAWVWGAVGIVIAAKDAEALRVMNEKIRNDELRKFYLCATHGCPQKKQATLRG